MNFIVIKWAFLNFQIFWKTWLIWLIYLTFTWGTGILCSSRGRSQFCSAVQGWDVCLQHHARHMWRGTFPSCPFHWLHKPLQNCGSLHRVHRHHKCAAVWDLLCCQISAPFSLWGKASRSDPASSSACPGPHDYNTGNNAVWSREELS